jgi:hypothetical protein
MLYQVILFALLFILGGIFHSPLVKAHEKKPHSLIGELHNILEIGIAAQLLIILNELLKNI